MAAIEIDGLSHRFGSVQALENVSFSIEDHEFVTLVGPSGCGKSTLLRIVSGLIPASAGQVRIDRHSVVRPHPDVGIVFQSATLLPWLSARRNIEMQFAMRGQSPTPYRDRVQHLMKLAGLEGFEEHLPHQLSGGMQQRVSICRALVHEPELLLLDEPFGALDAMTRESMNLQLQRIWLESRKTVLMITHGIAEAVFLSDRVVVMTPRPGKVAREIRIDIPRPRNSGTVDGPDYRRYVREVRSMFGDVLGLA